MVADYAFRTRFLQLFTRSLILSRLVAYRVAERRRENVAAAHVERKLLPRKNKVSSAFHQMQKTKMLPPAQYARSLSSRSVSPTLSQPAHSSVHPSSPSSQRKPVSRPSPPLSHQVKPVAQNPPHGFTLGSLAPLIADPTVQSLECPGAGRNVLVKRYTGIHATQIRLSAEDVKRIITSFAEHAHVPLAGGILKAAVGNLVISAVVSDFVGSRFIITKVMGNELPVV